MIYDEKQRAAVFETLVNVGRPMILKHWRRDSCIASTRIALDVMRRFSMPAVPMSVTCHVSTKALFRRIKAGTFKHPFRRGEWSVGVGFGLDKRRIDPNGYNGHLVLVCPFMDYETILDMSLDQCNRPERGMNVHCHATSVPLEWREGGLSIHIGDSYVNYKPVEERPYEHSPDWSGEGQRAKDRGTLVNQIVLLIEKRLRR